MPATDETYAATSAICFVLSWPLNEGITPLPFVTRSTTRSAGGIASSRFGPTVPVAPASFSVWQLFATGGLEYLLAGGGVALRLRRLRDLADDGLRRRCRGRSRPAAGQHGAADEQNQGSAEHGRESTHCRRNAQHGPPARRAPSGGSVRTSARLDPGVRPPVGSSRRDSGSRNPPTAASSATKRTASR